MNNSLNSLENVEVIKVGDIPDVLSVARKEKLSVMLWGVHGIGKTSSVADWCRSEGLDLKVFNLQSTDPLEVAGVTYLSPEVEGQPRKALTTMPLVIPEPTWQGVLFFDEITEADPRQKAAFLSLFCERRIGNYSLPDDVVVVAAGNPSEEGANYAFFTQPMADRFLQYNVILDVQCALSYMAERNYHPAILAYLKTYPGAIWNSGTFAEPSPRSWGRVNGILKNANLTAKQVALGVKGALGSSVGLDFLAKLKDIQALNLDIAAILEGVVPVNAYHGKLDSLTELTALAIALEAEQYLKSRLPHLSPQEVTAMFDRQLQLLSCLPLRDEASVSTVVDTIYAFLEHGMLSEIEQTPALKQFKRKYRTFQQKLDEFINKHKS